jgi:hypothetical protein
VYKISYIGNKDKQEHMHGIQSFSELISFALSGIVNLQIICTMLELGAKDSAVLTFSVMSEASSVGPQWNKWVCSFQEYLAEKLTALSAVVSRGQSLHRVGPDVQGIFF